MSFQNSLGNQEPLRNLNRGVFLLIIQAISSKIV
jgi:hypothetical protein